MIDDLIGFVGGLIVDLALPLEYIEVVEGHWSPLADEIARAAREQNRRIVVGINGAQGSGKTTLCRFLEPLLANRNLKAVTIALDDLYLTRAERQELAHDHHPLFATRGVPGTHDVALAESILDAIMVGRPVAMPRFDKSIDDRAPGEDMVLPPIDVILLEGWFVGAVPQSAAALREPVNRLEAEEDPDGVWRREVNRRLATDYAELFARIDLLVMLKVPDFDAVRRNRALQEDKLRARNPDAPGLMDAAALKRFLDQDERLTLHMFEEMPARADILIEIGPDQRPI
jgi:D-glycerate 3-kinase